MRVLCVGIDGADYDLVRDLLTAGRLPALARVAAAGAFGPLRSTIPAWTPTAWSSFLTGLNPGNHGVFSFASNPNRGTGRMESAASRWGAPLWRLLGALGRRSAFVTVPLTHPPQDVDGIMVTGFGGPPRPVIVPDRAARVIFSSHPTLSAAPKLAVAAETFGAAYQEWIDAVEELADVCKLAMQLEPELSFLCVDFMSSDVAGHLAWHRLDASHPAHRADEAGDELVRVYEAIDRALDDLVDHATWLYDEEPTVIVVSDHGMKPTHWLFSVNGWLEQAGLLRYRRRSLQRRAGGYDGRLARIDSRLARSSRLYPRLADRLPLPPAGVEASFADIDFGRSLAYCYGYGGQVYLSEAAGASRDRAAAAEVGAALQEICHPGTGETAFDVKRKAELYWGRCVAKAPDFVLVPRDERIHPMAKRRRDGEPFRLHESLHVREGAWSGQHGANGILAVAGPGFRSADVPPGTDITQLAATILALFGAASQLDGRPIEAVLAVEEQRVTVSADAKADQMPVYSREEEEAIAERLRSLGYE